MNYLRFITIILVLLANVTAKAQRYDKMSRMVRGMAISEKQRARATSTETRQARRCTIAMVRISGNADSTLTANGCRSLASWGDIHVAEIPLSRLSALSDAHNVMRIEAHRPNTLHLDTVRISSKAIMCHAPAADLPQAFTGKGVVVGVEDIGFDLTHPTFYTSDLSDYRIRRFWDMLAKPAGGYSEESPLPVGSEYITREEILAKEHATDGLDLTHGTHTTGIAAGSGYDSPYRGTAPDADICLVANAVSEDKPFVDQEDWNRYTTATDILGFKYIFDYAKSVGKPCVISFSEGSHEDLYGDCQLLYETIESMTGPGRIIVASAGNEGHKQTYMHKPYGKEQARAILEASGTYAYYTLCATGHQTLQLDFFRSPTEKETFTFNTEDLLSIEDEMTTVEWHAFNRNYNITLATYPSCYDAERWATELLIADADGNSVCRDIRIGLTIQGKDLDIECYASGGYFAQSTSYPDWNDTEKTHNVHFPAASPKVVCVGNSAWRTMQTNYNGIQKLYDVGTKGIRASTSSVGPTMQGTTKPDVMAPGTNIISAYSSYYLETHPDANDIDWDISHFTFNGRTYAWNSNAGTSMSCPAVAGVVALWLEACPTLTPEDVMETIRLTSRRYDPHKGEVPETAADVPLKDNEYGWGEIDAHAGLLHVLQVDGIKEITPQRPSALTVRPDGKDIVITCDAPAAKDFDVAVFSASGTLAFRMHCLAGSTSYAISAALSSGVYIIQTTCQEPALTGSTIVRL